MESIIIRCLMLLFIVVFIIDISGVVEVIKKTIFRVIMGKNVRYNGFNFKPFDCSLCMTFWTISLYSIYNDIDVIQSIFWGTLFAFISMFVSYLLRKIIGLIF